MNCISPADTELRRRHPDQTIEPLLSAEPAAAPATQHNGKFSETATWIHDLAAQHRAFRQRASAVPKGLNPRLTYFSYLIYCLILRPRLPSLGKHVALGLDSAGCCAARYWIWAPRVRSGARAGFGSPGTIQRGCHEMVRRSRGS
jgi:hypothetical protein